MTSPVAPMLPELDTPPTVWIDPHDVLADLPEDVAEVGERLGQIWTPDQGPPEVSTRRTAMLAESMREALLDHGAGRIVSPFTGNVGGVSLASLRGGRGRGGRFVGRLNHHTASASISRLRLTPALGICINGRLGLQGPLCNGYGGGDFVYRPVTFEWANHPGLGGPLSFSLGTVPKDNGRPYLWGTEWDWNGVSRWPDEYLQWMACCDAGLADFWGLKIEDQGEHSTWSPERKIDRNGISRAASIARTRDVYHIDWTPTPPPAPARTQMEALMDLYPTAAAYEAAVAKATEIGMKRALDAWLPRTVSALNGVNNAYYSNAAEQSALRRIAETADRIEAHMAETPAPPVDPPAPVDPPVTPTP